MFQLSHTLEYPTVSLSAMLLLGRYDWVKVKGDYEDVDEVDVVGNSTREEM